MKFRIGEMPIGDRFFEKSAAWKKMKEPTMTQALAVGSLIALLSPALLFFIFTFSGEFDWLIFKTEMKQYGFWLLAFFVTLVFLHEFVHAFFFPDKGLSKDTLIIFVPKKNIAVAFYLGEMPRVNFLHSIIAPFIMLTLIPLVYCLYDFEPLVFAVALANASLAGVDLLTFIVVCKSSPKGSIIRNHGYYSYFRVKA